MNKNELATMTTGMLDKLNSSDKIVKGTVSISTLMVVGTLCYNFTKIIGAAIKLPENGRKIGMSYNSNTLNIYTTAPTELPVTL